MTSARRAVHVVIACVLALGYWFIPDLRRAVIKDVISVDGEPGPGPELARAPADARGLPPADRVRVALVDGAGQSTAHAMPAWDALCKRGIDVVVDVGFPTVSLPVQVALWSGLTQQQTGILFHSGRPLDHPIAATIPSQVPGSIAVAESHPEIVGSIGFASASPPIGKLPPDWPTTWPGLAVDAVASPARLAFVHLLGVDAAGHKFGRASSQWTAAAADADRVLDRLFAAAPDATWIVLADHDHLAGGGHGGEERWLRQVRACIAGPGIAGPSGADAGAPGHSSGGSGLAVAGRTGGPIHLVDLSRAIADLTGVTLPAASAGRPLDFALAHPLERDDAVPGLPLGRGVVAFLIMVVGFAITAWGMQGRYLLGPWWFPVAALLLVVIRGVPTLSTPMIYKPLGRDMYLAFMPAFILLAAGAGLGLRRHATGRVLAAELALPIAAVIALITATGAWPIVFGGDAAPIVPRWTGWLSPALLMVAQGLGVVASALLATAVLPGSGRAEPRGTGHSVPAARVRSPARPPTDPGAPPDRAPDRTAR